ncbi:MAG: AtpZ/AtpI family protein [Bacillus sp. (in: firmicutes)]
MKNQKNYPLKAMAITSAIVSQLVGCILVGVFGGKWVDAKIGTGPLFLVVGLLLGLALGVYGLMCILKDKTQGD